MKKIIFMLLCGLSAAAQVQQKQLIGYEAVYVEAGVFMPVGKLKEIINPSVSAGFWYKIMYDGEQSLDIGFNLVIPDTNRPFLYQKKDSLFTNRPKGPSGIVGGRFVRRIDFSESRRHSLEWVTTLAYAFLPYRSDFIPAQNEKSSRASLVLSTVHIGQGIRFNFDNIGLQANYQYTPYGLFYDYIGKEVGPHSLTFSIIYRQ